MKLLFGILLYASATSAQLPQLPPSVNAEKIHVKWKVDKNKWVTGSLVFLAGAGKGFNETLTFHWKTFHQKFPDLTVKWFNPAISWRNKYEGGDPANGARFPLSTSLLVMTTDQYHLNNFITRASWATALVIKVGEGKKPFKYYLKDLLFYSACNLAGFALMYCPFTKSIKK
jgi:hypothetical protein